MLGLPIRDLVDAAYRLMTLWATLDREQMKATEAINTHFRNRESEYETGIPVLPGWAAIGDAVAQATATENVDPQRLVSPADLMGDF